MPRYLEEVVDERGPEPIIRKRLQAADRGDLFEYRLTRDDISRIRGFPMETVAFKFFLDEDLAFILTDVNDELKDPFEWEVDDIIFVPRNWELYARAAKKSLTSGRKRDLQVKRGAAA